MLVKEGKSKAKDVGPQVIASAVAEHASFIVLGARRQSSLAKSVLGSVSEYVLAHAQVPVVIARAQPKED